MQFNKLFLSAILIFSITISFSQIGGKAKHLPGTWVYAQGSGYEVWKLNNGELSGAGYRTNKLGDTVRVEKLGIKLVNKNLFYTLETGTNDIGNSVVSKHQFVSKARRLDFTNLENVLPNHIKYSFGLFNKDKMTITIWMDESVKKTKLKLRKKI